jgi:hypothetical protein
MSEIINASTELSKLSISEAVNLRNFGCNYLNGAFIKTPLSLSNKGNINTNLFISIIDDAYLGIWEYSPIATNSNKVNTVDSILSYSMSNVDIKSQGISRCNSVLKWKFSIFNKENKTLIKKKKSIRSIIWSPPHLLNSKISCMFVIALTSSIQVWVIKNKSNSSPGGYLSVYVTICLCIYLIITNHYLIIYLSIHLITSLSIHHQNYYMI